MREQSGRPLPLAAAGALIRAASRHGSVFSFHGVRTDADPVASIANVTLRTLRQSVELIQASAEIVGLDELHCRWEQGKSTRGLVAMTFDDAYASLLETADAWLSAAPFPLTIFVVTGASASGNAFWWDRLESLAPVLSRQDRLHLEAACEMPDEMRGQTDPVHGPLRGLRQWILGRHLGRAPSAFADELTRLEDRHQRRTTQRPMRVEELRRMARLGPVSFGVHTVSHPVLPLLTVEQAVGEIREAWDVLRDWDLPSTIPYLAVPFGLFSTALPSLSADCGMRACLVLNDRSLGMRRPHADGRIVPRWPMVEGTSRGRLAYRLSGLRDRFKAGEGLDPPPLPGELDAG